MSVQVWNLDIIDDLKYYYGARTNKELAETLGISPQHLARINNGRSPVPRWMELLKNVIDKDPQK